METMSGMAVTGLAVTLTLLFLYWGWMDWRKIQPRIWWRGAGIRFQEGTRKPWEGLEECIEVIDDFMAENYPELEQLRSYWIDVVSPSATITTPMLSPAHAKHFGSINGTVYFVRMFGLFRRTPVIVVRQLAGEDGHPLPAQQSALYHEIAEHLLPWMLHRAWNTSHNPTWHAVTQKLQDS